MLLLLLKKAVTIEPMLVISSKELAIASAFSLTVNTTTMYAIIEPKPNPA